MKKQMPMKNFTAQSLLLVLTLLWTGGLSLRAQGTHERITTTSAGQLATSTAFSITGGSGNVAAITDNGGYGAAITYSAENNTVSITYPDAKAETPVIITVTSAAGQTATATINVVVYSSMGFDSDPAASGIYAYIDDAGDEEETF